MQRGPGVKRLRAKATVYQPQPVLVRDEPLESNPDTTAYSSFRRLLSFSVYPRTTLNVTWLLTGIRMNFLLRNVHGRGGLAHLSTV